MNGWQARDILRRVNHRSRSVWLWSGSEVWSGNGEDRVAFSEFEAVAIAKEYLARESRAAADEVMKTLEATGLIMRSTTGLAN